MAHDRMIDFPGHQVRLERDVLGLPVDHVLLANIALEGLFAFSERLCIPLALEVLTAYWEDEFDVPVKGPPRPAQARMLRRGQLPSEIVTPRPDWRDGDVTSTDEVDQRAASRFVRDFLKAKPSGTAGMSIGWTEIYVHTCMARLPHGVVDADDTNTISVTVAGGVVGHPIARLDGDAWVYGPLPGTLHAPIEYRVHRRSGRLVLDIALYWDLWTEYGAGASDIRRGVDALTGVGWQLA